MLHLTSQIHPFPHTTAANDHAAAAVPALPVQLPHGGSLRVIRRAERREARWGGAGRRRGRWRRGEARSAWGVIVTKAEGGMGTAKGMTAAAVATPQGGGVGVVVVSASVIRGITVTASRTPRTSPDPLDPVSPTAHLSPVTPIVLGLLPVGQVDPSSRPHPVAPSVGTFGSGGWTAHIAPDVNSIFPTRETRVT